ncbi:hypothetical protein FANTH_7844 [Fusarium anthophilum]|uniref:Uncharacterized protein n=1 Tax=Fusarium anthophilum TaxID=48485 RepID=A0A8H4ZCQ3_9HYPO|nr:hypothetical protein FANTH_7844 [Fusarium anthophilum]
MRLSILKPLILAHLFGLGIAQTPDSTDPATTAESIAIPPTASPSGSEDATSDSTTQPTSAPGGGGGGSSNSSLGPPDVHLKVPELSVGRIELDVDNLHADINLNADIAKLVQINAGIQIGIDKVNITIADVEAELELVVRLGHLVEIVNRTLASLDLNPALINLLDSVGDIVEGVIGAVDGLLGSITQGDTKLNFLIDNLGNIVQEVTKTGSDVVSSIIGNYKQNMTFTGDEKTLQNGLTQRTYEYKELSALVNIVFNKAGQIVQAMVVKGGGSGSGGDDDDEPSGSATASQTATATSNPSQATTASSAQ